MSTESTTQSSTSSSTLGAHVQDYLRLRRALGFKLERAGLLLPQLVAYLEAVGATTVTSDLAIAWARLPERAQPNHWAQRLAVARGFARYLQSIDPTAQVPPAGVFPTRRHRPTPYLWSTADIARLLAAAGTLRPPLRAATHQTLFGLIAVSGMRLGETIGLDRDDVDFDTGVITIQQAKFDRSRLVPLHPSTTDALRALCGRAGPAVSPAPVERVLPLQRRHPVDPHRGGQDLPGDRHRARPAHGHGSSAGP